MFDGPSWDHGFRDQLNLVPAEELHDQLARVDRESAGRIHRNDRKRLVRALEVYHLTGRPISEWQTQWSDSASAGRDSSRAGSDDRSQAQDYRFRPVLIGLDWPAELINQRINSRVKGMFYPHAVARDGETREQGEGACGKEDWVRGDRCDGGAMEALPDEVRRLEQAGLLGPQAREAIGYKQVLEHFQGAYSLDEAFEQTKIMTRRFAKSQRAWLRRYRGVHWLDAVSFNMAQLLEKSVYCVSMVR
jgi:tRNA dimethylallyltransferase